MADEDDIEITEEAPAAAPAAKPKGPSALRELLFNHGEKIVFGVVTGLSISLLGVYVVLPSDRQQTGEARGLQSNIESGSTAYDGAIAAARDALNVVPVDQRWQDVPSQDAPALQYWSSSIRTRIDVTTETQEATPIREWHSASARIVGVETAIGQVTVTVAVTPFSEYDDEPEMVNNQLIRREHRSDPVEAVLLQRRTMAAGGSPAGEFEPLAEIVADAQGAYPPFVDVTVAPKTTYEYRVGVRGRNIPTPQQWSRAESATTEDIFRLRVIGVNPDPETGEIQVRFELVRIETAGEITVRVSHALGASIGCRNTQNCGAPFGHEHNFIHRVQGQQVDFNTGLTLTTVRHEERSIPWLRCENPDQPHEVRVGRVEWTGTVIRWTDADGVESPTTLFLEPRIPGDGRCPAHGARPMEEILRELGEPVPDSND